MAPGDTANLDHELIPYWPEREWAARATIAACRTPSPRRSPAGMAAWHAGPAAAGGAVAMTSRLARGP